MLSVDKMKENKQHNKIALMILKMMLNFYDTILSPNITNEPPHDKTNIMRCAPSEDSDQPVHLPSLIRVFAVRSMVANDPSFLHVDSED